MLRGPILLNARVFLPQDAIEVMAVRASGPGGQNVNKVSSKIDMRVRFSRVVGMSEAARARLYEGVRARVDQDGWVRITSQRFRDQARNYDDACAKVKAILEEALVEPIPRRKTRPSRGSVERRLKEKRVKAERKQHRRAGEE